MVIVGGEERARVSLGETLNLNPLHWSTFRVIFCFFFICPACNQMFWASSKAKTVFRWTSFQFFLPKAFRFFFFFLFSEFMINGGLSKTATWFQSKTMIKGPCRWYFCSIFNNNWYESAIVQRIIVLLFECLAIGAALSYLFHWSCQSNIQQRRENGNCLMEFQRTGVHEYTLRYCWSRLISYSLARRNLILCMVRLTDWGCWENGAISKRGLSGHQFSSSFFYVSHTRISVPIKTFMGVRSPYKPTPDFHVNAPIFQDNHCATYMQNAKLYNTFPNRLFGYALLSSRFVMTGAMLLLDITSEEKIDTLKSDIWNARFMSMTAHLLVCLHACWKPGHHATSRMTSFFCKKKKIYGTCNVSPPFITEIKHVQAMKLCIVDDLVRDYLYYTSKTTQFFTTRL